MWCPKCGDRPKTGWKRHCWEHIPGSTDKEERAALHLWMSSCVWLTCQRCGSDVYARNPRRLHIFREGH